MHQKAIVWLTHNCVEQSKRGNVIVSLKEKSNNLPSQRILFWIKSPKSVMELSFFLKVFFFFFWPNMQNSWSIVPVGCWPLRRRPVRSAGAQSPGRPRCQSGAGSPPDGDCRSSGLRKYWPDALYLTAGRRGGPCCTSSRQPEEPKRSRGPVRGIRGACSLSLELNVWLKAEPK